MSAPKRKKVKVDVGTITISLPEHIIAAAIEMQVVKHLEESVEFQAWLKKAIDEEVALIGPMHPNMNLVVDGVREHLDRFPLIANDQAFQDHVGMAIFEWLQKPAQRVARGMSAR